MNKIVLVTNAAKAAFLIDLGHKPCGVRQIENSDVCQFVVTDELLTVLNDPSKFNKNDYVFDTRLTF